MTMKDFADRFKATYNEMVTTPINRTHCLGTNLDFRTLAASGVCWNRYSKYQAWDYTPIALAVVIHSITTDIYRADLLRFCPPAQVMRVEFHELFLEMVKTSFEKVNGEKVPRPREWSFADMVSIPTWAELILMDQPFDLGDFLMMMEDLEKSIRVTELKKESSIKSQLDKVIKSEYLLCSEDGVAEGTMETLAYILLNWLVKVSYPHHDFSFTLCRHTTDLYLLTDYGNQSRTP